MFINFWKHCLKLYEYTEKINGYDEMFQFKKINVNKTGLCSWNWYFDGIINTFFSKQQVQTVFTNNFFIKTLSFFQVKNITLNLLNIKKQYEKYFYRIKKNHFIDFSCFTLSGVLKLANIRHN